MTSSVPSTTPSTSEQAGLARNTRKRRQKTFTGCWTCRSRHVKCDEQRPECRRCIAGKLTCQGYGTRLTWLSPAASGSLPPGETRIHDQSKAACRNPRTTKWKAFTVSQPGAKNDRNPPPKVVSSGKKQTSGRVPPVLQSEAQGMAEPVPPPTSPPAGMLTVVDVVQNPSHEVQSSTEGTLWEDVSRDDADEIGPWMWDSGTFHTGNDGATAAFDAFSTPTPPPTGLGSPRIQPEILIPSPRHRELINHWVTNLCHKLLPIRCSVNPFLMVVSPMALAGSRFDKEKSSSTVALFHAVCAISAAHLENLGGPGRASDEEKALTLHHKHLSFYHLMRNMHSTDFDERMASLSTLCLWLMAHFISGEPGSWREVAKVTRNYIAETPHDIWTQSATASATYQSYSSFFAMVQTQYLGRIEYPATMKPDLAGSDVHKSMAIPDKSLELISSFNAQLLHGDSLTPEKMDEMEIEFALSAPPMPARLQHGNIQQSTMTEHYNSLFYYACLLYFRCVSGRRGREDEIQDLVERSLEHMESLDAIGLDGSPRIWVYATVAFEAGTPELRERARIVLRHRNLLAFRSWNTVLLAAEEMWRQRDLTLPGWEPEPWPQVLARLPQFDVMFY